jgi:hypothetical protein
LAKSSQAPSVNIDQMQAAFPDYEITRDARTERFHAKAQTLTAHPYALITKSLDEMYAALAAGKEQ